ncbi:DUF2169 domain-containing protein [Polyangium sp. y55x31]|uniref:DUF2169 family type VI secretion system accessory protein n=1 Tax=Polyangium sp. y55x31 TaxID=3042688 RepID=UPI00248216DD|nr:DUF2169 domain-containing protein [Polyangium sp. y55x31]MDI1478100.1 DUF2169 domain-containing protein [Polyangium sp. y55x31]
MRTIKPAGLIPSVRVQAIGLPGRGCLSVTFMLQFGGQGAGLLVNDGNVVTTFTDEGTGVFDQGLPKVRGEVLCEGFAAGAAPAVARQVRLALGRIDKKLYVVGDRTWGATGPSEPVPYTKMRIRWENAFGGEGDTRNPVGKGKRAATIDGKKVHPLPNVEWPNRLVKSPGDEPPPAGFGPLDLTWEPRSKRVGTYGQKWLKTRYPELPDDFDPLFFNVAPEDQWMPGYFRGDEAFVVENMHPDKPKIEAALPGFLPRAFIGTRSTEERVEVSMHCDTVWIFPHVERVALIYRGIFPVATDDELEVNEVMVGLERLGEAKPRSHYEEVRRRRLDKERGALHALKDGDLLPEGVGVLKPSGNDDTKVLLEREGSFEENMRRRAELELQRAREQIRAAGLDPGSRLPEKLPPREEMPKGDVLAFMESVDEKVEVAKKEGEALKQQAMEQFRQSCKDAKLDPDEVLARQKRRSLGPPKFSAQKELETLRGLATLSEATGVPMPDEVYQKLNDPSIEEKLVLAEQKTKEAYRLSVHRAEAMPPLDEEDGRKVRAEVEQALRNGESLAGRDFSGVDLSGIDFRKADLSESFFESANVEGCRFDEANLYRAVLAHARAKGAVFRGARLEEANLGCADLTEADLAGNTNIKRVQFFRANLTRANLENTTLDGTDFTEAKLEGTKLKGCKAEELMFSKVSLAGADLSGSVLEKCNFLDVDCTKANFTVAKLDQSVFLDVEGDGAIFRRASLQNLRVVRVEKGTRFTNADFRDADMTRANLRGARLAGSTFVAATLHTADFSETDLTGAKLMGVRAAESRFERANLTNADLRGADLLSAMLARAMVAGANFEEANLFRADGARMVGDTKTSFKGANLKHFRYLQSRGDDGQGNA